MAEGQRKAPAACGLGMVVRSIARFTGELGIHPSLLPCATAIITCDELLDEPWDGIPQGGARRGIAGSVEQLHQRVGSGTDEQQGTPQRVPTREPGWRRALDEARRFVREGGRSDEGMLGCVFHDPEPGLGVMEHAAEHPFIGATTLADEAASFIERAPPSGFSRGYALGRALLLVRTRPDALVKLLDRASDPSASPALRDAIPWLIEELVARDDGRRAWQERRVNAELTREPSDAPNHHAEAARRRSFALTLRQDDRFPRGRGMTERSG